MLYLIRREARKRQLAEFLDGTSDEIGLDGWTDFRKIVGNQNSSRKLFSQLHLSHSSLFKAPAKGKLETQNQLHRTIIPLRLSNSGNAESVINRLGAVLFAASRKTKWHPDRPDSAPQVLILDTKKIQSVLVQSQMITTLKSHVAEAEFKSLISHWLDSLKTEPDTKHTATMVSVIGAYQLSEKSDLTLQVALDKKISTRLRSSAIGILSQIGSAEILPKLSPLLDDSTVVGNYIPTSDLDKEKATQTKDSEEISNQDAAAVSLLEVQIRDLALATSIILQDNSLDEFGFRPQALVKDKLVTNQAGFFTEKERAAAFSKWNKHGSKKKN